MTIAFRELAGSPEEVFGPEGMQAQRRLVVAWEDRHAMAETLLGVDGAAATYPDRANIVATEVRIEPWPAVPTPQAAFDDVTTDLNSYSGRFAQLTVDYEWLEDAAAVSFLPAVPAGTFLTYRMDIGSEYSAVSGAAFRWYSNSALPVPADAFPVVRVPIVEHQLTWHRVTSPPWSAIHASTGMLNQFAFLGAAAETVLFDGATATRQFLGFDGQKQPRHGWKLTYLFREKSIKVGTATYGWNHRYRALPAASPDWDRLVDAAGRSLYATRDLLPLFQFGS